MKIELEFNTKLTDVPDILQKVSQIVKSAKEQGFDIYFQKLVLNEL